MSEPERRSGYFDMDGNPITVEQWGALFSDMPGRTIAEAQVQMPDTTMVDVRTVWLGHVEPDTCCARMFGTAVKYPGKHFDQVHVYDTREQATAGHADVVVMLRDGRRPDTEH
jgi:hypothetical protein